jgi:DNA mismatch endonuclease (patch repair protein)
MRTKPKTRSATNVAYAEKNAAALRSRIMRSVRRRGTDIELSVNELLKSLRISDQQQPEHHPGQPDFASQKKWAIFVHGCFWHGHRNCDVTKGGLAGRLPATNKTMWAARFERSQRRDRRVVRQLNRLGCRTLTVWGCETRALARLRRFVGLPPLRMRSPLCRRAK